MRSKVYEPTTRDLPGLWVPVAWVLVIGGITFWWAYDIAFAYYLDRDGVAIAVPSALLFLPMWAATHSFAYRAGIARSYRYDKPPGFLGAVQKQSGVTTEMKPGFILAVAVEVGITCTAYFIGSG